MSDDFYITGGTLPLAAESYVVRTADSELLEGLRRGEFCYVLDTRQMGKSSLMVRTARRLKEEGRRVAVLDLTALGQNLTVEQWYSGLLGRTAAQTGRMAEMLAFWKEHRDLGPMQRFLEALRQVLLTPPEGAADGAGDLVLFVDEIDAVRTLPFSADEFFAGIRECYNRRPQDPAFARLTFCLLGVAAPTDLVRDTRLSPFNIGRRIEMCDFTPAEAGPLAAGLAGGGSQRALRLLRRVLSWTSGHPYMTQRLCRSVAQHLATEAGGAPAGGRRADDALVDGACRALFLTHAAQETDDNLAFVRNRLLHSEIDVGTLLDFYLGIRRGRRVRDDAANPLCSLLRLSGVVTRDGERLAVRNRIYYDVFDPTWVHTSLPEAEVLRQRRAFRRGARRTALVSGVVLLMVAALAGVAVNSALVARRAGARAVQQEARARSQLSRNYVEAATRFLDAGDDGAALAPLAAAMLLDRDNPARLAQHRRRFAAALALAPHLDRLWGADGPLRWASFSPDKTRIAAAGEDGRARVWEVATGRELPLAMTRAGAITDAAFSPDGTRLVTCGEDARAQVWDLNARRLLWTLGPLNPAGERDLARTDGRLETARAAWSRDGGRIATAWGGTVTVWDLSRTGGLSRAPPVVMRSDTSAERCTGVAFAPDGKSLAVVAMNYIGMRLSVPDGRLVSTLGSRALGCYVGHHLAYSRDGRRLLVAGVIGGASQHPGAGVYRTLPTDALPNRVPDPLLMPHARQALYAAFSPDERRIVTGGDDGTARVWDAATGQPLTPPLPHARPVVHAEFSPDGRRVVTASLDGTARVWDAATGRPVCAPLHHAGPLVTAQFGADGTHVFTAGRDGTARLWTLPPPAPAPALRVRPAGSVTLLGGTRLAVRAGHLRVYDLLTSRLLSTDPDSVFPPLFCGGRLVLAKKPAVPTDSVQSFQVWDARQIRPLSPPLRATQAVLSPDGAALLLREADGTIRLLNPATGRPLLPPLRGAVGPAADNPATPHLYLSPPFTPDGRGFLMRDGPRSVRLRDTRTGRALTPSMRAGAPVAQWVFSPDGRYLFTWARKTQAWNVADGTPASAPIPHSAMFETAGTAQGLTFSPDGRCAVSVGETCGWLWRLDGAHTLRPQPFPAPATSLFIFSPDGATLAALGQQTWLWNARTLAPIPCAVDYGVTALDAAFSPDGRRVLAVLADGTASVWDARTGHPVTAPLSQSGIVHAVFSPDGTLAATLGADGAARVWDAATGEALTPRLPLPPIQDLPNALEFGGSRLLVQAPDETDVWSLPTNSEPLTRLQARARLLSGSRIDPDIGPVPVTPATLRADWALVGGGR